MKAKRRNNILRKKRSKKIVLLYTVGILFTSPTLLVMEI